MYEEIGQLKELEAKDPETYSHMLRVSRYSGLIAVGCSLTEQEIHIITLAAKYHDIGKIVTDRRLLNNNLKLSEEQLEEIQRTHVFMGEAILKPYFPDSEILKIVRHHHENYDRTGYPDGLKEEEIPLGSRIIAVTDSYDAMLRPYNCFGDKDRIHRLKEQKGKQFDPYLIDVVLELIGTQEWHGAMG